MLLDALVFAFRIAIDRELSVRDVAPGDVAAAVLWQLLQPSALPTSRYVVGYASATNSDFALVLGLLAFLYLATVVVLRVEIHAVHVYRLWPRALLTPFPTKSSSPAATSTPAPETPKPNAAEASNTSTSPLTKAAPMTSQPDPPAPRPSQCSSAFRGAPSLRHSRHRAVPLDIRVY